MIDPPDMLSRLRAISKTAAFNKWLDFDVTRAAEGEVEMQLRWRDEFGQYSGFLHAGIVAALLDTACGFAAATMSGDRVLASQISVRFLRPAVADIFVVRGRVVKPGRQQIFATAELFSLAGEPVKILAVGDALLVPVTAT